MKKLTLLLILVIIIQATAISQSCLPDGITFTNQLQIDNFPNNYPYCVEIAGDVEITGSNITNLDGLDQLVMIDGSLDIHNNENLESISGLSGLEFINNDFLVTNNDMFTGFDGLQNLQEINGDLKITGNEILSTLEGLDSIESESIQDLVIAVNANLSFCHVQSVCDYLLSPNGTVIIQGNVSECSDEDEVILACIGTPPSISLSPEAIYQELQEDDSATQILTIHNTGENELDMGLFLSADSMNKSIEFNGQNTYIRVVNDPSLNIINSITFEAWAYAYDWDCNPRFLQKGTSDNQYRFHAAYGDLFMELKGLSTEQIYGDLPETNEWHHVAGVYNQELGYIALYIDGNLEEKTEGVSGTIKTSNDVLCIATKRPSAPDCDYFNGLIDEVRIWNIARTQEEILQNMYNELSGTEDGLAGYWKLNEGSGDLVYDATSNSNNGRFINNPEWFSFGAPINLGWLAISTEAGIIPASSHFDLDVMFNSMDYDIGIYLATLNILSNDPENPEVEVPVQLVVSDPVFIPEPLDLKDISILPNPFSTSTNIEYEVYNSGYVQLMIYNQLGESVRIVVDGEMKAGEYKFNWDARHLPAGVYFCVLKTNEETLTMKMIKLK